MTDNQSSDAGSTAAQEAIYAFAASLDAQGRAILMDRWRDALTADDAFSDLVDTAGLTAMETMQNDHATLEAVVEDVISGLRDKLGTQAGLGASIEGLEAEVEVAFDSYGVGHIRADTEADAYRAQGYLTARDRLWQMDLMRRIASGRAAAILGAPMLESDKHFLVYDFAGVAKAAVDKLNDGMRGALTAYAAGVNACIADFAQTQWPMEFTFLGYTPEPWTIEDSMLITRLQAEALSSSWLNDLMREQFVDLPGPIRSDLFATTSPLDEVVFGSDDTRAEEVKPLLAEQKLKMMGTRAEPAIDQMVARKKTRASALRLVSLYGRNSTVSNNWVISGDHTESGAPLLANDPHLQNGMPGIWHMVDMSFGDVAFAGVTIPGLPGILVGHNADIAWGVTNVGADVQDLYWEDIDDKGQYDTPDGKKDVHVTTHEIMVRSGPETTETVPFTVRATRHGPIVFEADGDTYALSWSALDPANQHITGFYELTRAKTLKDAQKALLSYDGPPQNFVLACRDGDIGAQVAGYVNERKSDAPGLPMHGPSSTSKLSRLSPSKLPAVTNPPSGVIATANNRTIGLDYPYLIAHEYAAPYRARRIVDLITSSDKKNIANSLAIQGDTLSIADCIFVSEILAMARLNAVHDQRWTVLIAVMGDWDGMTTVDNVAVTMSAHMRDAFTRRLLERELRPEKIETYLRWDTSMRFVDGILRNRPADWLPDGFDSYEDLVLAAFDDAVARLAPKLGTDVSTWRWGLVAPEIVFAHPLAALNPDQSSSLRIAFENGTGGFGPTVNAGAYVSMRFVADLSDWNKTRLGLPLGQSGDIQSAHFTDQLDSWRRVTPPRFAFGQAAFDDGVRLMSFWPTATQDDAADASREGPKTGSKKPKSGSSKTSPKRKKTVSKTKGPSKK